MKRTFRVLQYSYLVVYTLPTNLSVSHSVSIISPSSIYVRKGTSSEAEVSSRRTPRHRHHHDANRTIVRTLVTEREIERGNRGEAHTT